MLNAFTTICCKQDYHQTSGLYELHSSPKTSVYFVESVFNIGHSSIFTGQDHFHTTITAISGPTDQGTSEGRLHQVPCILRDSLLEEQRYYR